MDSSGISIFLAVAERVPVEIRNPSPIVRQLIEMTGLTQTLHLTP
jgi:anti-anti-sigma regulatory factor